MINQILSRLLIEGKGRVWGGMKSRMLDRANAFTEYAAEHKNKKGKMILQAKAEAIYELIDDLEEMYQQHIEEIKSQFPEPCLDISTDYLEHLEGWNSTPSELQR
jgi:tricorn protease-like protein